MHLSPRQHCTHHQYLLQLLLAVMTSLVLLSSRKRVDRVVVDMMVVDMMVVDMMEGDMVDITSTVPHTH